MKKIQRWVLALTCLTVQTLTSCVDHEIPANARGFISQYFPGISIVLVEMEEDEDEMEYCVWLGDGSKVEFDMLGEWKRVGRKKTGVPASLIPTAISQYVKANYPEEAVFKLSKKPYGYKIELSNDMDLRFTQQGRFIEVID